MIFIEEDNSEPYQDILVIPW